MFPRLLLLLGAAAMLCGLPAASATTATFRVGAVLSLTGPDAESMADVARAYRLWEETANAQNDGRGVNITDNRGFKMYINFELTILDDRSLTAQHVGQTQYLMNVVNVHFMFGGHYRQAGAQRPVVLAGRRATLHCCVESPAIFRADVSNLLFGISPSNSQFGNALFPVMRKKGIDNIVVFYTVEDPFPFTSCTGFIAEATAQGFTVSFSFSYESVRNYDERAQHWGWSSGVAGISEPFYSNPSSSAQRGEFLDSDRIFAALLDVQSLRPTALVMCSFSKDGGYILKEMKPKQMFVPMTLVYPAATYNTDQFIEAAGDTAGYVLGSSLWESGVSYSDWLFGNTTAFEAAYAEFNESIVEADVNISHVTLSERGVAAAGVGSLLLTSLRASFLDCRINLPTADSLLFSSSALVCPDGLNDGYARTLKTMRLTTASTVFGPVNFDKWQQNAGKLYLISQLTTDRLFRASSISSVVVLPIDAGEEPLLFPAPGTDIILTSDFLGKKLLAACLLAFFTLFLIFSVMCCNVTHPVIKKSRWAFTVFIMLGAMGLTLYPFFFMGIPNVFVCNMRNWFANGGVALMISGTLAKVYAQTQVQNYPLAAKKHKLTSFKVLKWTAVVGGAEVGIQFAILLFAKVVPVRSLCVLDHSFFAMLLFYAPFALKALVLAASLVYTLRSRLLETPYHESKFIILMVYNSIILFIVCLGLAAANRLEYIRFDTQQTLIVETILALYAAMSTAFIIILPKCLYTFTARNVTKGQALKDLMNKKSAAAMAEESEVLNPEEADEDEGGEEGGDGIGDLRGGGKGGGGGGGGGGGAGTVRGTGRKLSVRSGGVSSASGRKMSSAILSKRGSTASGSFSEKGYGGAESPENQRMMNKKIAMMNADLEKLAKANALMKTNMELMKLATQEQLVHASEIISKFRDAPTVAPTAAPLPSSLLASDVRTGKRAEKVEPLVVRRDSIPLETAIEVANSRAGQVHPNTKNSLIRRFSSDEKIVLVKKLRVKMLPGESKAGEGAGGPSDSDVSRSPSPVAQRSVSKSVPPLFMRTAPAGVPPAQGRELALAGVSRPRALAAAPTAASTTAAATAPVNAVSSSALKAARLYATRYATPESV